MRGAMVIASSDTAAVLRDGEKRQTAKAALEEPEE
jgi:hypothetical protein